MDKPWDAFVITKFPVAGSYVAPVGVSGEPPVTETALVAALTNTWVLDTTSAVITAPVPAPPPGPTLTVIVFASKTVIGRFADPPAGSVDLG